MSAESRDFEQQHPDDNDGAEAGANDEGSEPSTKSDLLKPDEGGHILRPGEILGEPGRGYS